MDTSPAPIVTLYQGALTIAKAQAISGIDHRTIKRAIEQGNLQALKPPGTTRWRIPEQALQQWLSAGATPPGEGK